MWLAMRREKRDRRHFKRMRGIVPLLERWLGSYVFCFTLQNVEMIFETGWVICLLDSSGLGTAKGLLIRLQNNMLNPMAYVVILKSR